MDKLLGWIQTVAVPWLGPPGLFLACFLDSSFLSLPEISDLLVVTSSAAQPRSAWVPILMATLGSLAGCSVLWALGKRGGEGFLVRRFGRERVEKTRAAFERWDLLALALPAMAPPPMPFKLFVFSAGVFGIPFARFALMLVGARGLRYVFWALMGIVYGDEARVMLQSVDAWFTRRGLALLAVLPALLAAGALAYHLWRRSRAATAHDVPPV